MVRRKKTTSNLDELYKEIKELKDKLSKLESREKELDKRLTALEKREAELEQEVNKLKFVIKKKQELLKRGILQQKDKLPSQPSSGISAGKREQQQTIDRDLLRNQIREVLKRSEIERKLEEEKKKILEERKPIKKDRIDISELSTEEIELFKLLVERKKLKLSEAALILNMDKEKVKILAEKLKKHNLIKISYPLVGEPKLEFIVSSRESLEH